MKSLSFQWAPLTRGTALAVAAALLCGSGLLAEKPSQPITRPKFDPSAERVAMFDAMDAGDIEVTMISQDAQKGSVLISNKTDKPLTVEMPDGFVGVQILKQGGNRGGNSGGNAGGGGQATGGGGNTGGGNYAGGGSPFSVPPDKTVRVPYQSVCLEHGKADPNSRMKYRPVRVEEFTTDPQLQELVKMVGTQNIDPKVAQAAAWNISNKMSWKELANKEKSKLAGNHVPYFSQAELAKAELLVSAAAGRARERKEDDKKESKPKVETRKPLPR